MSSHLAHTEGHLTVSVVEILRTSSRLKNGGWSVQWGPSALTPEILSLRIECLLNSSASQWPYFEDAGPNDWPMNAGKTFYVDRIG